ncbi:MAG: hypothetical protein SGBAC_007675 [Bacillariaceae sp.]
MPPKYSGIQKEVFGLYRTILREASKKDHSANPIAQSLQSLWSQSDSTASYARKEFRYQAHKVKLLKMPGVKVVSGA